ncbi:hypothetical protein [Streptomyces sp. KR80]|uniref:hypothetical protein n=1 Tax=Streptomyces sp. KR80 TaxID=3457426 RepID=UPI003FCFCACD
MRSLARGLGAAALAVLASAAPAVAYGGSRGESPKGSPESFTIKDPRVTESSGLAASRAHPGIFWTHNDSDDGPYVYAVDSATGRTVATVTLSGVDPRDLEAISVGPGGQVYVGDIGDNLGGSWPEVWIYRFREPEVLRDTTVTPVRHTVRYAGGPRDAESLMVHPKTGRVYIVSKHEDGGGLYEGPEAGPGAAKSGGLSASGVNTFRRVADVDVWATDGAFSPDGTRLVVRGYFEAVEYRWKDGTARRIGRPSLPMQRQGESVTFTSDGRALMYGTEGAQSRVARVTLHGDLLPDSVADAAEEGAVGSGKESDDGGRPAGEGTNRKNVLLGAVTFAAVAVLVLGLRRRSGRRR